MKEILTRYVCDRCKKTADIPADRHLLFGFKPAKIPENWHYYFPTVAVTEPLPSPLLLCPECAREAKEIEAKFLKNMKSNKKEVD